MNAYLSIDLDYWRNYASSNSATRFFNKVFSLNIPWTFVIEHEELVPDINKTKKLDMLYNVDYHSDIVTREHALKEMKVPQDYCWANFVKRRTKAEFLWIMPHPYCYFKQEGLCHGEDETDNPFTYPKKSGWKSIDFDTKTSIIDWQSIQRIGICLSPLFVELKTVFPVLKKMNLNLSEIKDICDKQPWSESQRIRGTLKPVAA